MINGRGLFRVTRILRSSLFDRVGSYGGVFVYRLNCVLGIQGRVTLLTLFFGYFRPRIFI